MMEMVKSVRWYMVGYALCLALAVWCFGIAWSKDQPWLMALWLAFAVYDTFMLVWNWKRP